jgi:hypothetical protein
VQAPFAIGKQPRILEADRDLMRDRLQECQLVRPEAPWLVAMRRDRADQIAVVAHQRHAHPRRRAFAVVAKGDHLIGCGDRDVFLPKIAKQQRFAPVHQIRVQATVFEQALDPLLEPFAFVAAHHDRRIAVVLVVDQAVVRIDRDHRLNAIVDRPQNQTHVHCGAYGALDSVEGVLFGQTALGRVVQAHIFHRRHGLVGKNLDRFGNPARRLAAIKRIVNRDEADQIARRAFERRQEKVAALPLVALACIADG